MKLIIRLVFAFICTGLFYACEQEFKVELPDIVEFSTENTSTEVLSAVSFKIIVNADAAVVWTGDSLSNYESYIENPNKGMSGKAVSIAFDQNVNAKTGKISMKYKEPGIYNVVLVATNVSELGENVLVAIKEITVQIVEETNE